MRWIGKGSYRKLVHAVTTKEIWVHPRLHAAVSRDPSRFECRGRIGPPPRTAAGIAQHCHYPLAHTRWL